MKRALAIEASNIIANVEDLEDFKTSIEQIDVHREYNYSFYQKFKKSALEMINKEHDELIKYLDNL